MLNDQTTPDTFGREFSTKWGTIEIINEEDAGVVGVYFIDTGATVNDGFFEVAMTVIDQDLTAVIETVRGIIEDVISKSEQKDMSSSEIQIVIASRIRAAGFRVISDDISTLYKNWDAEA